MTTTLCRTPVKASMSARLSGVSSCVSRPALTARPAREPCEVRIKKQNVVLGVHPIGCRLQRHGQALDRCTSAFLRIVLHVDRTVPKTARYDLCGAGRLASKHALIAEKAEGHHAHPVSTPGGVHP